MWNALRSALVFVVVVAAAIAAPALAPALTFDVSSSYNFDNSAFRTTIPGALDLTNSIAGPPDVFEHVQSTIGSDTITAMAHGEITGQPHFGGVFAHLDVGGYVLLPDHDVTVTVVVDGVGHVNVLPTVFGDLALAGDIVWQLAGFSTVEQTFHAGNDTVSFHGVFTRVASDSLGFGMHADIGAYIDAHEPYTWTGDASLTARFSVSDPEAVPVPEPTTIVLVTLAGVALLVRRGR
jgi:hypothetical protein